MADTTKIEWTDATWQVITGCSVVSPGCTNCYAMKLAGTRLKHHPSRKGLTDEAKSGPVWNGQVRFNEQWLDQPLRWKRPRRIFVCAHGDLFHENVPDEWIDKVFAVMALAPQHTFQVLTKRPERMREYLQPYDRRRANALGDAVIEMGYTEPLECLRWPLPNVWLGVSVEDQKRADERIPLLLDTPAALRFISAEPLLGPVDLTSVWARMPGGGEALWNVLDRVEAREAEAKGDVPGVIDWVIAGGESGPGSRPMHPDWARSLRDQCAAADVPFFFKQRGDWSWCQGGDGTWPTDARTMIRLHPDGTKGDDGWPMQRIGKKAAGAAIDGREYRDMPEVRNA